MLGETNGGSGQIEALGGDAIDELLDRIKGNGVGGNGGNNDNTGGGDGGGGEDPSDAPVNVRMLLDAAKQIAEHAGQIGRTSLRTTEKLSDMTIGAMHHQQDAMEAIVKQLHSNAMSIFEVVDARLGVIEKRLEAIEAYLGGKPVPRASGADEDAGGGP